MSNCRDFSVVLCAILRHQGVPSRTRCGFGTYFLPEHYEDHWVCEVWSSERRRWILVDAQLDALQREVLQLDFDPLDVPYDRFIVASHAWQMVRTGHTHPDSFGIFEWHGFDFIRGNLVRDFIALNKVEILPWDGGWGYLSAPYGEAFCEQDALFDRLAELTDPRRVDFAALRAMYDADPRWYPPVEVTAPVLGPSSPNP
jgi:transglutaminase-like putative cysteine protease